MYCLSSRISGWARRLLLHQRESAAVSPTGANSWIAPRSFVSCRNLESGSLGPGIFFGFVAQFGGPGSHPIGPGIFLGSTTLRAEADSSKNIFRVGTVRCNRRDTPK